MNFMRDELQIVRTLVEDLSKITNKYLDFIVNKCGPVCIFCMFRIWYDSVCFPDTPYGRSFHTGNERF